MGEGTPPTFSNSIPILPHELNSTDSPTTRRTFLKQAAVAGAAISFPAVVRAANLNGNVQLATVGVSGQGFTDVHNFSGHPKVKYVGFCDIDKTLFKQADETVPGVTHFTDFRDMLDKLGDKVDAVSVSIPDHMHARVGIEAMKRGKNLSRRAADRPLSLRPTARAPRRRIVAIGAAWSP